MTQHALYQVLDDMIPIRIFMENHVFSVWLFMCLLQSLIHRLSGSTLWHSPSDYTTLKILRTIMFEEETDVLSDGSTSSHLDMYIKGMKEVGASTHDICSTLSRVRNKQPIDESFIQQLNISNNTKDYIRSHLDVLADETSFVSVYNYFTYGREVIIPGMFKNILHHVKNFGVSCPTFIEYLERHIELDVSHAQHLLTALPTRDDMFIHRAFMDRVHLWDGIYEKIMAVQNTADTV